jgi:hypothetical protein
MTDHSGLRYFFDQPKLHARQARWIDFISEFDFEIKHIKGKENRLVDALSRSMKLIHLVVVSTYETNIKERVKISQETNVVFNTVKSYLEQESTGLKYEVYEMLDDDLQTYKGWLYIPNCDDLKSSIMDELHKRPYNGHFGYQEMITSTRKSFYWPRMKKDIAD